MAAFYIYIDTKHRKACCPVFVIPKRFERLTHALEGRCSIQLSYGTSLMWNSFLFPRAKIVCLFGCSKYFLFFF